MGQQDLFSQVNIIELLIFMSQYVFYTKNDNAISLSIEHPHSMVPMMWKFPTKPGFQQGGARIRRGNLALTMARSVVTFFLYNDGLMTAGLQQKLSCDLPLRTGKSPFLSMFDRGKSSLFIICEWILISNIEFVKNTIVNKVANPIANHPRYYQKWVVSPSDIAGCLLGLPVYHLIVTSLPSRFTWVIRVARATIRKHQGTRPNQLWK